MAWLEDEDEEGTNAERVSRVRSWVVGAVEGGGGGAEESKALIDQRAMESSFAALERIRSPCQATQSTMSEWISEVEKWG